KILEEAPFLAGEGLCRRRRRAERPNAQEMLLIADVIEESLCHADLALGDSFIELPCEVSGLEVGESEPGGDTAGQEDGDDSGDNRPPAYHRAPGNFSFKERGPLSKGGSGILRDWAGEVLKRPPDFVQALAIIFHFTQPYETS